MHKVAVCRLHCCICHPGSGTPKFIGTSVATLGTPLSHNQNPSLVLRPEEVWIFYAVVRVFG